MSIGREWRSFARREHRRFDVPMVQANPCRRQTPAKTRLQTLGERVILQCGSDDLSFHTGRVLKGLETTDDLYFDVLRQVKMDRWSKGRMILTGDAAWCATPIAGVGTTLAIVGAYVLAGELAHAADLPTALRRYGEIMRPFVETGQGAPKIAPKMLQPHTRFGVTLQHAVLRVASTPGIKQIEVKMFATNANGIDLPEYEAVPLPTPKV
ncbi:FAD-dependent monooxygenase [Rhizobium sp. S152]|uniref:FAD-dependent monooxygenase n=1 Tax=Rhizobium sp. S152 TaxID=3055038 RepID=UPI0025A964F7|nr:FAD-dependent monooxygenase [Rhizobium sp. S152]MDM9627678.1 FAD-dependent monooxygenase [Rhizobium sp. S152]